MNSYSTSYGLLQNIGEYSLYPDGGMKECMLQEKVELTTNYGELIPQYEFEENRRKYIYSLAFYEDGALRKIALNQRTPVKTPIGIKEAELITFYRSGKLKRLFPLNGRISAYWDENEEYRLAKQDTIELPGQIVKAKVIAYSFYECGALKDITLWPKELVKIKTPVGEIRVRIGLALYMEGSIKSLEPCFPIAVQTPIGEIKAYDYNAIGISGDRNSLVFGEDGSIKELITSGMRITVQGKDGAIPVLYSPEQSLNEDGLEISFRTLKLSFGHDSVCFNDQMEYKICEYTFVIEPYQRTIPGMCDDCSSCSRCSDRGEYGN